MKKLLSAALIAMLISAVPLPAMAEVYFSISIAPPALPIYVQPMLPDEGYIWIPGYWDYDDRDGDYYWVPGTWARPPRPGLLWTPGYWFWNVSFYSFRPGYWGPRVGYYGGIDYGHGYHGRGYDGGRWERDRFFYNRAVNNIDTRRVNVRNVYNQTVITNTTINRISYNGGKGGIDYRPSRDEEEADREAHVAPTADQTRHQKSARSRPDLRRSANRGRPPIAATARPASFDPKDVVPARDVEERPAGGGRDEPKDRERTQQQRSEQQQQQRSQQQQEQLSQQRLHESKQQPHKKGKQPDEGPPVEKARDGRGG